MTPHPPATEIDAQAPGPGAVLAHPLTIAMLALWIINDHYLKAALGNELTGKLSDVASLAVFPLIPVAVYEIFCGLRGASTHRGLAVLLGSLCATGSVMVGINLWDSWAYAYRVGLGLCQWPFYALYELVTLRILPPTHTVDLTMDPTDIWTLPALVIPAVLQIRIMRQRRHLRETGGSSA